MCSLFLFDRQSGLQEGGEEDYDEDCLDSIPLMCGDSFEMDESDRLVNDRRRRRSQYRSIGYFLSEGWINLCARSGFSFYPHVCVYTYWSWISSTTQFH
jgi:hypothetical protein